MNREFKANIKVNFILAFIIFWKYINGGENIYEEIHKASSITHSHMVSKIACSIYSTYVIAILDGASIWTAYTYMKKEIKNAYQTNEKKDYLKVFSRILDENIALFKVV